MPVVDVLQASLLAEPGIPEQALEPLIVAVGLLILHQQPDKVGVGELGVLGIIIGVLAKFMFTLQSDDKPAKVISGNAGSLIRGFPISITFS